MCFLSNCNILCLCIALRKAHHIKDDQKTMGKHIRKARKCDRADSLLHSHSTMCISLPHYTLSFTSFPPFLCFSFSFSLTHTYTTCHCYHITRRIHLLCMSDRKTHFRQRLISGTVVLFLGTEAHGLLANTWSMKTLV